MSEFHFGKDKLTASIALQIAQGKCKGVLTHEVLEKVNKSAAIVQEIAHGEKAVYGINTGFGPLCNTQISPEDTSKLQHNILKSHSVGVGDEIPLLVSKLMLITKAHGLCIGYSGIAEKTIKRIVWHIDNDCIPCVPSQGSVGASGDLAPLAHLFLPLIGHGKLVYKDQIYTAAELLQKLNLQPLTLGPKEGLALINGTQFISSHAVLALDKFHNCLAQADLIAAMMVEGLLGSASPFLADLHKLRSFKGNVHVAHRMSALLKESKIMESHVDCDRVQDPYSLRCIPQIHGSSRNTWLHLKEMLEIELNSVTDNPIIINKDLSISGGNFHGQPMALPLDYMVLGASELGNVSDRRIYLSLMGVAKGVPKLLMNDTGINSAFMMLQYTSAALASENKNLCFPASADSIPTSLGQEDHVSMGSISARKALQVINNLEKILSIEMVCAAQSIDYHLPLKSTPIINKMHAYVRSKIKHATVDRIFADDINIAIQIFQDRKLLQISREENEKQSLGLDSPFESLFEEF